MKLIMRLYSLRTKRTPITASSLNLSLILMIRIDLLCMHVYRYC
jgi:hypothetical protein